MDNKEVSPPKKCKKVASPVMKSPPVETFEEEEDIDSTQEDELQREATHDEFLEAEWKRKMERMRKNRDEAIAKLNRNKVMY